MIDIKNLKSIEDKATVICHILVNTPENLRQDLFGEISQLLREDNHNYLATIMDEVGEMI